MERRTVQSGAPWEALVGYSRAVRVGDHIWVSGTTATDQQGEIVGVDDPHAQTVHILQTIQKALEQLGSGMGDVVRTRMFVMNIEQWPEIGRAHAAMFGDVRPAASMIQVTRLIDPRLLVEIEVDAVVGSGSGVR